MSQTCQSGASMPHRVCLRAGAFRHESNLRVAIFYTKVHDRLLSPLIAGDAPPAAPELRTALATIDRHVAGYADRARLGKAA